MARKPIGPDFKVDSNSVLVRSIEEAKKLLSQHPVSPEKEKDLIESGEVDASIQLLIATSKQQGGTERMKKLLEILPVDHQRAIVKRLADFGQGLLDSDTKKKP